MVRSLVKSNSGQQTRCVRSAATHSYYPIITNGDSKGEAMKLVRVGGRVKSAAVGLDRLFANSDSPGFEKYLSNLRENPPRELLEAFFPSNQGRLKQLMRGVGFYLPLL